MGLRNLVFCLVLNSYFSHSFHVILQLDKAVCPSLRGISLWENESVDSCFLFHDACTQAFPSFSTCMDARPLECKSRLSFLTT